MKFAILSTLTLLLAATPLLAHEDSQDEEYGIRILETFSVASHQVVYLTARDQGHVLGQPFIVETRVSCSGTVDDVKTLDVKDSYSVCDMQPMSIKMNLQKTAVAMKYKAADVASYYQAIEDGQNLREVPCQSKTELLKFSLKNLCR